jgi:hypothetical protein
MKALAEAGSIQRCYYGQFEVPGAAITHLFIGLCNNIHGIWQKCENIE